MQKAKVDCLIALFAYSGNGGIPGTIPEIAVWLALTFHKLKTDDRIGRVGIQVFCDTPITMTRNRAVKVAQEAGFDMVLMLDSDNEPDAYLGKESDAKPFWDVAFTHAYDRLMQGKPTVIAAPYCGPPPTPTQSGEGEVPYLFQWINDSSDEPRPRYRLHRLNRNEAAQMRGVHRVAALPTGVCLFTTGVFDGLKHPYFDYEMTPDGADKQSTEDVYATRNISLLWQQKIGENVVFAACDSWAWHHKVKKVGRPCLTTVEHIAADFADAVRNERVGDETLRDIDFTAMHPGLSDQESEEIIHSVHDKVFSYDGDDDSDLDDTADTDLAKPAEATGITYRVIGGRKLAIPGEQISQVDIEAIEGVAQFVRQSNGPATRVIAVNPQAGEVPAALLSGSVHSTVYGCGLYRDSCVKNLETEPRFRMMDSEKLERAEVDMVFLDSNSHNFADLLDDWSEHVAPNGFIAGRNYDNPNVSSGVRGYCELTGTQIRLLQGSSVWFFRKAAVAQEAGHAQAAS